MLKMILDKASRVIKRVTSDESPMLAESEFFVEVKELPPFKGYMKLGEDDELYPATQEEIDASGVDETRVAALRQEKVEALNKIIDDIIENGKEDNIVEKLKSYFTALKLVR